MSVLNPAVVKKYFVENGESWVRDGYEDDGYNYPVGLARMRRILAVLKERYPNGGQIVDLGCGGGQVALGLAAEGFHVTGVDQSSVMISSSRALTAKASAQTQSRVKFVESPLENSTLAPGQADAVISMGVIGYLSQDSVLLNEAMRLLKPGGLLLVSCRNRLFNMVSISDYTLREIDSGGARELVQEIKELIKPIPAAQASALVESLTQALVDIKGESVAYVERTNAPVYKSSIEARQHTPRGLEREAIRLGFKHQASYGVHPHLMMAGLNRMLPKGFYNRLSSSLDAWGDLPVSLIWSSVFISVLRKP